MLPPIFHQLTVTTSDTAVLPDETKLLVGEIMDVKLSTVNFQVSDKWIFLYYRLGGCDNFEMCGTKEAIHIRKKLFEQISKWTVPTP